MVSERSSARSFPGIGRRSALRLAVWALGAVAVLFLLAVDGLTRAELVRWAWFLAVTGLALAGLAAVRRRAGLERAAEERRWATLERLAAAGIFRVDGAGCVREATPWWAHVVGKEERDCVGADWWAILPDVERPAARERWQTHVALGQEFAQDVKLLDGEGRRRSLLGRWAPAPGEGGHGGDWVGAFVDVTEQRSVEARLHQAQKLEAVGRLTGSVVHDFNNLLSVILTNSHLLLTDPAGLDAETREMVGDMERAARSGQDLVKRLMGFSRRSPVSLVPLDLAETVAESAKPVEKLLEVGCEMELDLAESGLIVQADPRAIEQILLNLVSNAREAMPGGGRIRIAVDAFEADASFADERPWIGPGRWGRVTVSDTGVGMDEATREQIFDPFFTTKREGKGRGLGLSTVHGLMRRQGGHIQVYSEPGAGTTFRLYFPVATADVASPVPAGGGADEDPTPLRSLTVLLVEDDEELRRTAARILVRMGYAVLEAPGGEQALRLLAAKDVSVDLILCDLTMAGMDGVELHRRLRERGDRRPFIFTSGRPERDVRESGALPAGAVFLEKPWAVRELTEVIRELGMRVG